MLLLFFSFYVRIFTNKLTPLTKEIVKMKKTYSDDGVRTRLILSALSELCEHGVVDFSLRRVAQKAEVSCAAPYRHFKSKEELIAETAKYITSKWSLLTQEIKSAYGEDPRRTLEELSSAAVGFWIANGNFRSLLVPDAQSPLTDLTAEFDTPILEYADLCFDALGDPMSEREQKKILILSLIYGSVVLVGCGKLSPKEASASVKRELSYIFYQSKQH